MDSFERIGEWWLPGETAQKGVPGRLSFDPGGGVRLETLKPFPKERELALGAGFRPDIVHGFTDYTTPVTLYRVTRVGNVRPPESDLGSTFYARYAVLGHHFHEVEEVRLASLQAGFTDLEEWAKHYPFAGMIPVPGEPRTRFREMKPVQVGVDSLGARLTIKSVPSWGQVPMKTLRWEHRIVFEIEPEEPEPLGWYRDVLRGLQDLLTLLMGRPTQPSALNAQVHKGQDRRSDVFFEVGKRSPENGVAAATGLSPGSGVLIPLPKIRREFPNVLNNWFAERKRLAPVHGLFFETLFSSPGTSPEFQFLSLAQALESYHRRTRPESLHEPEEDYQGHYDEMVAALPASMPDPLRQSLTKTLTHGNEWSLRKRLKALLGDLPDEGVVDRGHDYFTDAVVKTRNYLSHYPEDFEDEILEGSELHEAVDELRRMLAFFLLKDSGIGVDKVTAAVSKVPRYEYYSLED